jgi:hypothetical protein
MHVNFRSPIFFVLLVTLALAAASAQQKLTKEEVVAKSNTLYRSGRAREALDLIGVYPEYGNDPGVLDVESVARVDLRDFARADAAFQKQFDSFLNDAAEGRAAAEKFVKEDPPTKENRELALLLYGTIDDGLRDGRPD